MADESNFTPVGVIEWPNALQIRSQAQAKALDEYGIKEEHNGRGDAYRHLVASALLAKKYGNSLSEKLGNYHESSAPRFLLGGGDNQDPEENSMDMLNNALGREIAAKANTPEDIFRLAKEYVDSGKASYMSMEKIIQKSKEEEETGYY